jgi:site-specific DNA-methyltransferase (adenine-specific)
MEPFYQDNLITLYCGDMREIIPALGLTADAVITDPPYGETSLSWDRWPEGWPKVAAAVAPQMWCFGSLRMFMDKAYDLKGWKLSHDIVWEKQNGSSLLNDRFRRIHEYSAHFYRDDVPWAEIYKNPVYANNAVKRTARRKTRPAHWGGIADSTFQSEDGGPRLVESIIYAANCHGYAVHPTQKPQAIVRPLLQYSVPVGGSVLDCFAGSGTTLIEAREMGIKAIGIEGKEAYCEEIVKRLSQSVLPFASSQ